MLKFANKSHIIDAASGEAVRRALESGRPFVTISMDFSGCGQAVYPVTINTAHVSSLVEKLDDLQPALAPLPDNVFELRRGVR